MSERSAVELAKAPTGIRGLDEITCGGIPRGRATLLLGGPGSGKTLMALQTLVNGARHYGEPGIFVGFEEASSRIRANAASLGWDIQRLQRKFFFLDAQPAPDLIQGGGFDLLGMLSALEAKVSEIGAKRIVFDSVDIVLAMLNGPVAERREIYRLHDWLLRHELTALITAKMENDSHTTGTPPARVMQFMVDCSIVLQHELVHGVSQRSMRVLKYRGSAFAENQSPFVIAPGGLEVAGTSGVSGSVARVTTERVPTGINRLDAMLGGGYFRGASVLVTGSPGTAKSTLGGAFAEAACQRGERVLFFSFDSDPPEIVRNLASVKIRLARFQRRGLLRVFSASGSEASAEVHYLRIRSLVREHGARCLVIDPVSALAKRGNESTVYGVVERLTRWARFEQVTLLCTSLLDGAAPECESTKLQVSTIADTWIHLSYRIHAGERNRALTIIKSRGTAHSNQVRELILSSSGVSIAEVFTAGGEVLMGTLRWEKEEAVRAEQRNREEESQRKLKQLESEEAELAERARALARQMEMKRMQRAAIVKEQQSHKNRLTLSQSGMRQIRQADPENKPGHHEH